MIAPRRNEKLEIVLPVMLHSDTEPEIFLQAKDRLEKLGRDYNVPIEVGAFLLYLPSHSRTPENFEKQVKNQERYRLPIRLVETGVQRNNALAYVLGDTTFNPEVPSDLERTIEQSARLRDLDENPVENLIVAPQVGVLIAP